MVSILQSLNGELKKLSIKEFSQVYKQPEGVLWIDLDDPSDADKTADATSTAAKKTGHGIKKGVKGIGHGVKKGADKTADAVK